MQCYIPVIQMSVKWR